MNTHVTFYHYPWMGYYPRHDNQWHPGRPEAPFRPGEPPPVSPPLFPMDTQWPPMEPLPKDMVIE